MFDWWMGCVGFWEEDSVSEMNDGWDKRGDLARRKDDGGAICVTVSGYGS